MDAYTDQHPVNQQIAPLYPAHLKRYRGICNDLFWDHCLLNHWTDYHTEPVSAFINRQYRELATNLNHLDHLPETDQVRKARMVITRMVEQNWLPAYAELDNVCLALQRIGQRLTKPQPLGRAVRVFEQHPDSFLAAFQELMRDILLTFSSVSLTTK